MQGGIIPENMECGGNKSAHHVQVVHIDLGIAFEQGRFLNTPELVPFRLTRDIVDGMGAAGTWS